MFKSSMNYSLPMRLSVGLGFGAVLALVLAFLPGRLRAEAVTVDQSRYQLIIDRNPFALKDPPPPPVAPPPTNPPPVEVNLKVSGFSVTPDGTHVHLVVPPTPGKNTNAIYWRLAAGERQGDVEVVSIDYSAGEVTVVNAGQRAILNLEEHSPAAVGPAVVAGGGVAAGARAAAAARLMNNRGRLPTPGAAANAPGGTGSSSASTPTTPSASRVVVPPGVNKQNIQGMLKRSAQLRGATVGGGATAAARTVPARPVRTVPVQGDTAVDPAMQWLMLKAQEEQGRSEGLMMPPTPPMIGGGQ
ncbi:MAG: hypothetical protein RI897_3525 [Verrucomicrobiota bacterium]